MGPEAAGWLFQISGGRLLASLPTIHTVETGALFPSHFLILFLRILPSFLPCSAGHTVVAGADSFPGVPPTPVCTTHQNG
jgi:hypothetical protein